MSPWRRALAALALLAGCAQPALPPRPEPGSGLAVQPELASGWTAKPGWRASQFMVAAAHPLAVDAGYEILRAGGNAVDAAVAVQMVLALVEPQSSGLGGGAFLLLWDGREVQAWDGRETAPAAADESLFLGPDGRPLPFAEASHGGRAVGAPGALKMLEAVHRHSGALPWARLFEPAIALAEGGFPLGARLRSQLAAEPLLPRDPRARAMFYRDDGTPHPVGQRLRNPALGALLRGIAARGSDAFYRGPAAAELALRVRTHAAAGKLSEADLAAYEPKRRAALCALWQARYRICGMPPPSSGQLALMQILGLLEQLPVAPAPVAGVPGPDRLHTYQEATRLAFADRAAYVADPDFVPAPAGRWDSLLDTGYLARRAALIGPRARPEVPAGAPGGQTMAWAPMPPQPESGTSQVSIVDGQGRAVALTTSVEAAFGARLMADGGTGLPGGYLLNNQLTDFALAPRGSDGRPVANRLEPGKRPRSSMSPTLVFDTRDGRLLMSLGSAGGPYIIHYTARALLATLAWGLEPQPALDAPNFGAVGGPLVLEQGRFPAATVETLRARGHRVAESALTSGTQLVLRTPAGLAGAADPRREGIARGD